MSSPHNRSLLQDNSNDFKRFLKCIDEIVHKSKSIDKPLHYLKIPIIKDRENNPNKGVHMFSLIEMENSLYVRRLEVFNGQIKGTSPNVSRVQKSNSRKPGSHCPSYEVQCHPYRKGEMNRINKENNECICWGLPKEQSSKQQRKKSLQSKCVLPAITKAMQQRLNTEQET